MTSRWPHAPAERVDGPGELDVLDEASCWVLLHRLPVGRIAVGRPDGTALVVPVNFSVAGRSIVFHAGSGSLVDALHHRASFQVDVTDGLRRVGWSVLVEGTVSVEDVRGADPDADGPRPWAAARDTWLVRIAVERITGRCIRPAPYERDPRAYL